MGVVCRTQYCVLRPLGNTLRTHYCVLRLLKVKRAEQIEVAWSKVGAIRRMLEVFPLEISQHFICLVGSMGMRVDAAKFQVGQVPQCTGRLCWEIKAFFKSVLFICLSSISICNLLIDLPSYLYKNHVSCALSAMTLCICLYTDLFHIIITKVPWNTYSLSVCLPCTKFYFIVDCLSISSVANLWSHTVNSPLATLYKVWDVELHEFAASNSRIYRNPFFMWFSPFYGLSCFHFLFHIQNSMILL
jgi:hypothetical protein